MLLTCADGIVRIGEVMVGEAKHLTATELDAGVEHIKASPRQVGVLDMIVRRPRIAEREILAEGELDLIDGLVGDNWKNRSSKRTADGTPHPDMQLNVINSRVAALVAGDRGRWPLAGDQLYVDLDLSEDNLPPGTRLQIGAAVIEVTAQPHTGCSKFLERFGADAMKFVNSAEHRGLRLRGLNARVVSPGLLQVGDAVNKL